MSNPNNCTTCDHRQYRDDGEGGIGHCYMFQHAPTQACLHHTYPVMAIRNARIQMMKKILESRHALNERAANTNARQTPSDESHNSQ